MVVTKGGMPIVLVINERTYLICQGPHPQRGEGVGPESCGELIDVTDRPRDWGGRAWRELDCGIAANHEERCWVEDALPQ